MGLQLHGELAVVASVAALGFGPVLHWLAARASRAYSILDGFIVVAVLGLALLEIVPLGLHLAGWPALLAVAAGVVLPNLFERKFGGAQTHKAAIWAALAGMALHAFTDGLAVAGSDAHGGTHAMAWAVVLHRIPVGLAVWWMLTGPETRSQRNAALALATIAGATVVGYAFGGASSVLDSGLFVGLLEAFVGGLLLHVVSHGIGSPRSKQAAEHAYLPGVGGLLGLAFVLGMFVVPELDEGTGRQTVDAFWDLVLESAPALLLAYGLAGLIGEVLGEAPARWLRRGGSGSQAVRGVVFGLPLPLCSCGVVPVYRSLVSRGVPATAGLAFLVATPELGLDAILVSVPLLGGPMTLLRVAVAFALALIVGWLVGGWARRWGLDSPEPNPGESAASAPDRRWIEKLRAGFRVGYGDVLDSTGPWILVGLLLAAFVQPWVDAEALTRLGPVTQVAAFALIGLPVYVCATGATPLVAVLIAKGLSPGAALAFLLTGPATNATTFGVLEQLHGRKVAIAFVATMLTVVVSLGCLVNLAMPGLGALAAEHVRDHDEHSPFAVACAVALTSLFTVSLVRQGPRRFLGRLWELASGHDHDHDHDDHDHDGHDHDHDHDHASEPSPATTSCCSHANG